MRYWKYIKNQLSNLEITDDNNESEEKQEGQTNNQEKTLTDKNNQTPQTKENQEDQNDEAKGQTSQGQSDNYDESQPENNAETNQTQNPNNVQENTEVPKQNSDANTQENNGSSSSNSEDEKSESSKSPTNPTSEDNKNEPLGENQLQSENINTQEKSDLSTIEEDKISNSNTIDNESKSSNNQDNNQSANPDNATQSSNETSSNDSVLNENNPKEQPQGNQTNNQGIKEPINNTQSSKTGDAIPNNPSKSKQSSDLNSQEDSKREPVGDNSNIESNELTTENSNVKSEKQKVESQNKNQSQQPLSEDQNLQPSNTNNEKNGQQNSNLTNEENLDESKDNKGEKSDLSNSQKSVSETDELQNSNDDLVERKEKLERLRDILANYVARKQEEKRKTEKLKLNGETKEITESNEEKYELSEQTNNFINQLNELPSFENRDREAGYSIDTQTYTEIPDSLIRTLITKFLNQRFCKHSTDLNIRSNSLEKSQGFHKWEVKDVIKHLETEQIMKVFDDKYGYKYADGKNETVPLSFYFDLSGSMSAYTNMLAVIAIELLKKNVKVLIGFNERVNVQIESINKNIDVETLAEILESAGYSNWEYSNQDNFIKDSRVTYKFIDKNIDNYLISKKAEKCVVFADFDPREEVINLSQISQVYWFCFESNFQRYDLSDYKGFIYPVKNTFDIADGLIKVNDKRFETLCYTENPKTLKKTQEVLW